MSKGALQGASSETSCRIWRNCFRYLGRDEVPVASSLCQLTELLDIWSLSRLAVMYLVEGFSCISCSAPLEVVTVNVRTQSRPRADIAGSTSFQMCGSNHWLWPNAGTQQYPSRRQEHSQHKLRVTARQQGNESSCRVRVRIQAEIVGYSIMAESRVQNTSWEGPDPKTGQRASWAVYRKVEEAGLVAS